MKRLWPAVIALALVSAVSCNRGAKVESEAAVRAAIERYLASRPNINMQGMDMQVSGVKFRGPQAEADVTFRAKTDSNASLSMRYILKRQGDRWEVEPQTPGSMEGGHGGMGMMPPAGAAPTAELPSGHPPVGSQTQELPAGHPPVKKQ